MSAAPAVEADLAYFEHQLRDNDEFFARFGEEPRWRGAKVLDFGCGHGAMSLRAARAGADQVVALDLAEDLVAFGRSHIQEIAPEAAQRIEFVAEDVATVTERFDLIISKDTFEHVADVTGTLRELAERLEPGGEIWVGFSQLFYGPTGSHGRLGTRLPWAHTLPWPLVRRIARGHAGREIRSVVDVGLNGLTPAGFRRAVSDAGLTFRSIGYNRGGKPLLGALSTIRRVPGLERYATVSIYARLTAA